MKGETRARRATCTSVALFVFVRRASHCTTRAFERRARGHGVRARPLEHTPRPAGAGGLRGKRAARARRRAGARRARGSTDDRGDVQSAFAHVGGRIAADARRAPAPAPPPARTRRPGNHVHARVRGASGTAGRFLRVVTSPPARVDRRFEDLFARPTWMLTSERARLAPRSFRRRGRAGVCKKAKTRLGGLAFSKTALRFFSDS